ncbi:hypothetical protein PSEUDO9AG_40115 [Pseudomonas sp. 9Ag]|nr:hypothetical protein PSEUDO9AG_40115 [Pseudomonas sp. 9Ag]
MMDDLLKRPAHVALVQIVEFSTISKKGF